MSGTSLDGIDLAELKFQVDENEKWCFEILKSIIVNYPPTWKKALQDAFYYSEEKMLQFNEQYTQYLAEVISEFIKHNNIHDLDAVCSHGHTIWHQPKMGMTLQIGNLSSLAKKTGQKVVCDFRVQDVQLGGNGAPLVPIGDRLLFGEYDYCLNLGGFANISYEDQKENRIAYDVCPVNIVMNHFAELCGKPYDDRGLIAASGKLNADLLTKLNSLDYYIKPAPKSLGMEWVQHKIVPILKDSGLSSEDILHTFVEHVAIQLAAQFHESSSVLITGGGAYNEYLINRLKFHSKVNITIPSSVIVEYKEALIFGLLGVLKLRNSMNCLASVTGAENDHSSGHIFIP